MTAGHDPGTEGLTAAPDGSPAPGRGRHQRAGDAVRTRVMLLGSGDFSRELAIVLQRLGAEVIAVECYADAPAHGVADQSVVVQMSDTQALTAIIGQFHPHFVVTVTDKVGADALIAAAGNGLAQFFPTARGVRLTADREALRRLAADELGLPTAPFWFAGSLHELRAVADHAGYPLRVQPVTLPAGQRESVISGPQDLESAWQRTVSPDAGPDTTRLLVEAIVEIDFHITLLAVRRDGPAGPVIDFCAPIGRNAATRDTLELWQPQEISTAALDAAKSIAARIVKALGGRGVFGVELMVRGDEVYFCDVSVRPYESALVTLRTQRLSAFELQARAILGLAGDTIMISPGAAQLLYTGGTDAGPSTEALAAALAVPESDVRMFTRSTRPDARRLLAVAVVTAADAKTARRRARQASAALVH
ncbi:formate-dependent phosphoribosylglycinamide formyltransferase [Mycobacterium sp.]|uniref:formate-dependent phosphoribosylglycinamide formyltransferase n=1 Tax=Mycobacterium sp. TaxID=1785 RepID=UPI00127610EF|nr:formate-dependent phosphoribosylglycinamide formyltransferase [Mycobacterium sp.]KAA8969157.1 MAG: formate-dependent phosphoribosylglycinamide formyltransferase [Mycobacterium sp.]